MDAWNLLEPGGGLPSSSSSSSGPVDDPPHAARMSSEAVAAAASRRRIGDSWNGLERIVLWIRTTLRGPESFSVICRSGPPDQPPVRPYHLDLRLQAHAPLLLHPVLHRPNQLQHLGRSAPTGVDEIVAVHRRDFDRAHPQPLESRRLDELPTGTRTLRPVVWHHWILEHAAAARLVERRAIATPAVQLLGFLVEQRRVRLVESHRRRQHDHCAERAASIGETSILRCHHAIVAFGVHHQHRLDHVTPLGSVTSGVHHYATTPGPRHANHL